MTDMIFNSYINNLASITLGLAAWALPIVYLFVSKRRGLFCWSSLACVVFSLFFQLLEVTLRVQHGDFAAIEDTTHAVSFCAAVLVAVTLALNLLALLRRNK